ncbi:ABC transporter permease [Tunturiibacter psychrotolerans]|uniref:ABC transporter permease n=1 Tax=Tunturiibacter psychrotolerans TaxID=3069686 RepID=UPI003D9B36D5
MRWWQIGKRDEDLEREMRSDLELEEEEQREKGLSPEQARYAARRAFGNTTLIREQTHEAWGWASFERLSQDLKYALRQLGRSPGFTSVCLITLALGIGANTAMFSIVQGLVLAPLPFPNADRLVFLWQNRPGIPQLAVSYPNFEDWERTSRSFDGMSAVTFHNFDLTAPGRAAHILGIRASSRFLATLGVEPVIGRDFAASEDQPNGQWVLLISNHLWRERFGADPYVVGRSIDLDGKSYTVIGVLPAGFHFLADADIVTLLRPNMPVIFADRSEIAVLRGKKPAASP